MKKLAPILIPTLNRYEHLKRCVESLAVNTYANDTELIIGLDYPPSQKYEEGYNKIKEYLPSISGFKKITILTTEFNLNTVGNYERLVDYAKNEGYESYIFSEDDNEFSPGFLSYCNWALDYFKEDKSIFYICGFGPIDIPNLVNNVYKYNHCFSAWGCATWFDRRQREVDAFDFVKMKHIVDSYPISIMFHRKKVIAAAVLLYMIKKQYVLGDTAFMSIPEDERWCIFPKLSMVRNWGHDGSGLHGGTKESFAKNISLKIDDSKVFIPHIENDLFDPEIKRVFKSKYGHKSLVLGVRSIFRYLIYKLTGQIIVLERPAWLK